MRTIKHWYEDSAVIRELLQQSFIVLTVVFNFLLFEFINNLKYNNVEKMTLAGENNFHVQI